MALFSATDNAAMIAALGEPEGFTLDDGTPAGRTVQAIYDGPFQRADMAGGIESYAPRLTCSAADTAGVAHGTRVTRVASGTDYYVTGVQPDGHGMTVLTLSEDELE